MATIGAPASATFTIKNNGVANLDGLAITKDGANANDFVVTSNPPALLAPGASGTFVVQFNPSVLANESAILQIASNAPVNNPFNINLTGQVLLPTADTDGDGISDAGEFTLAALGFDWQASQPDKVAAFLVNSGLYTPAQVRALNVDVPLLSKDPATGQFKLTLGIQKSVSLSGWEPLPFTSTETTINTQGQVEFLFTAPGNAAFFRVEAR